MKLEDYKKQFTSEDAPGFAAILKAVKKIYPETKPTNWAPTVPSWMGGISPLDNISYYLAEYNGEEYYHFVTYGFSQLYYNEQAAASEQSKFGFELTFRLQPYYLDEGNPSWVIDLLQNIARYVHEAGNPFGAGHILPLNGPLRLDCDTQLTGVVFILDPQLGIQDTPHGNVQFLQMVAVSDDELNELLNTDTSVEEILSRQQKDNPLLLTDLDYGLIKH